MRKTRARALWQDGEVRAISDGFDIGSYALRGHVDDAEFRRVLEHSYEIAVPGDDIERIWWRCVPCVSDQFAYLYYPAEPHSRGAFPVTYVDAMDTVRMPWAM